MRHFASRLVLSIAIASAPAVGVAPAQSGLVGWGSQVFDSRWNDEQFIQVAAGQHHTIALRGDGTAVAWGSNYAGECIVPTARHRPVNT